MDKPLKTVIFVHGCKGNLDVTANSHKKPEITTQVPLGYNDLDCELIPIPWTECDCEGGYFLLGIAWLHPFGPDLPALQRR